MDKLISIQLKDVSQLYQNKDDSSIFIIDKLNLFIEHKDKGKIIVILGKSGCGKSTILRYISSLQKPTSGEVLINGNPIKTPILMVFQQYSSFYWYTVLKNVMLPLLYQNVDKKEAKDKALDMLKKVGLEGHENKYAQYPILSGGQLQRVAIARSLINYPNILLMDEPFGALDIHTRLQMQLLINNIKENIDTTIIFVTHDITEAVFLADEIYVMAGKPSKIIKNYIVDLPQKRDRSIRKDAHFLSLSQKIEDFMFELD